MLQISQCQNLQIKNIKINIIKQNYKNLTQQGPSQTVAEELNEIKQYIQIEEKIKQTNINSEKHLSAISNLSNKEIPRHSISINSTYDVFHGKNKL